jgi:hypothetical protein
VELGISMQQRNHHHPRDVQGHQEGDQKSDPLLHAINPRNKSQSGIIRRFRDNRCNGSLLLLKNQTWTQLLEETYSFIHQKHSSNGTTDALIQIANPVLCGYIF